MRTGFSKFFSILLVICMIVSMIPTAVFAATPGVLYLKPNSEWLVDGARFAAYYFGTSGDTWVSMTDSDGDGYYEASVPSGYSSVIFCRMNGGTTENNWDNKWNQTGDLTIPTDGKNCWTLNSGDWEGGGAWSLYACNHPSHNTSGVCTNCGQTVGHSMTNGVCTVCGYGCSHSWSNGKCSTCGSVCAHANHNTSGKCTICSTAVSHTYSDGACNVCGKTCTHSWNNGTCSVCSMVCTHSWSGNSCTVCDKVKADGITVHFVNVPGWQAVCAYLWVDKGGTTMALDYEWPGQVINRDTSGVYTMVVDYEPKSGESLGMVFHNFDGAQTTDVVFSYSELTVSNEVWVKPDNYTNDEGKYACAKATSNGGVVISPEVNGNQVTFRYQSTSATNVRLAGSFTDWGNNAIQMSKSGSVWSTTVTLEKGVYEYKFIVDGLEEWPLDPSNGLVGGYDNNSVVVVGDAAEDTGEVTVVLHFYREASGSTDAYMNWQVRFWCNENSDDVAFTTASGDKGRVASFTANRSSNSNVGFIVYTMNGSEWVKDYESDRFIDISDVASGTVHYFINAGSATGNRILDSDVVMSNAPSYANLDYDSGNIWVKTLLPVSGDPLELFSIVKYDGSATDIAVTKVTLDNNGYSLSLSRKILPSEVGDLRVKCGSLFGIRTDGLFTSKQFAEDFTYTGNDLGATWTKDCTTFKVWAPTAKYVELVRYQGGTKDHDDWIESIAMTPGEKGVWSVTVYGDLNGTYYNYSVQFSGYTVEATDPYATSTGIWGNRAMVLDLDSTDPEGWENDVSPNQGMSYNDAIIYEMHVREMTIDSTSGVKSQWRGKYLGMTQTGTNYQGRATALDHLKELGVTHVQLMPVFDFEGADEANGSYAWGYSPKNFNVPEGSYATDAEHGEVRVNEFKEMVQTFHENGINVIMDVVYNHTYSGGDFYYNKIVPNYFSRFWSENNWSNGSGVGNDIATERSMARNYIVDSVMYWVEEYHIDGFRFDLVGLIDTTTMYEVVETVHAKYPQVIFYGEGWTIGDTAVEEGYVLALKQNASHVQGDVVPGSGLGFFNDDYRNAIAGDNGKTWGFASGSGDVANTIRNGFRAQNGWSNSPTQTINYVSCHDDYCLTDKLILSRENEPVSWEETASMNRLANATVMLSQGVPLIYSGDEILREKKDGYGNRHHNSGESGDYVNKIYWNDLVSKDYAQVTDDYYAGLIEFRKNHSGLRNAYGPDSEAYVWHYEISSNVLMFYILGNLNGECSDGIVVILNGSGNYQNVNIYDYFGIPTGDWQACIHGDQAGINPIFTLSSGNGSVGVNKYSATVLVLGDLVDENSVYHSQSAATCKHTSHNTSGLCTACGASVDHVYSNGTCSVCGESQTAPETVTIFFDNTATAWDQVFVYSWTTAGGRSVNYSGAWPGSSMKNLGNNLYAITLPADATNIIFNDGSGNQTDDLAAPAVGSSVAKYVSSTKKWETVASTASGYYVAGSMNDWATNSTAYQLRNNGMINSLDLTLAGGQTHEFKVTNGSWSSAWPTGNCVVDLTDYAGSARVTVTFDQTVERVAYVVYGGESCAHTSHNTDGICTDCGVAVNHTYVGGSCSVCGATEPGSVDPDIDYYLVGYINGANYGCEEDYENPGDYKFVDGKITATFDQESFVFIKTGDNANWYMAESYISGNTGTFKNTSTGTSEKMLVPGGVEVTFTLVVNEDGSLTLSYTKAETPVVENSKDIKWQVTNGTSASSTSTNLRLLTWVDSPANYSSVTFNVTINGRTSQLVSTTAYTAILASGVAIRNPANIFKNDSANYFVTYTLKNIPSSYFDIPIVVTVTWKDLEGNETTSEFKTIVISSDWA